MKNSKLDKSLQQEIALLNTRLKTEKSISVKGDINIILGGLKKALLGLREGEKNGKC